MLITIFPFIYMVLLSVRPIADLARDPGQLFVPFERLTFGTYDEVLRSVEQGGQGFLSFLRNSAIIAVVAVIASLLLAIPGAYAISRLGFFGRRQVSFMFLAVYLFPAILLAIPLFVFFTRLGLRGSLIGLIIVYASQTVPVTIHMLRNYFHTIRRAWRRRPRWKAATASRSSATSRSRSRCRPSCRPVCSCS